MTETFFPVRTPALGLRHSWLKSSPDREFGIKAIRIANGQGIIPDGALVAQITVGAASSAALVGNTGDGTLTLDATTPVLSDARAGVYEVRFVEAETDAGRFEVRDPEGNVIGLAAVGDTWSKGVKFAIADGAADFVAGDGFDITVASVSGDWGWYDPDAVDGRALLEEGKCGLLHSRVDATSDDVEVGCVVRRVVIDPLELSWHTNVDTQAKKDVALAQLAKFEIEGRHVL